MEFFYFIYFIVLYINQNPPSHTPLHFKMDHSFILSTYEAPGRDSHSRRVDPPLDPPFASNFMQPSNELSFTIIRETH